MSESSAIRKLTQPKVAAPICIAVLLFVVVVLFAVFYIRNPTFATDMFMSITTTPSSDEAHTHTDHNNINTANHSRYALVVSSTSAPMQSKKSNKAMSDGASTNSSGHA
ncbi:hypothetical protein Tcan_11758 [Toxocara canis]|uniref:Uncharacterized protein n=1 Tax=Toxocara canis TaxID=6265 RepID=A0A0B2UVT9_TOXCA|nr:hypothetical protein Tcan_11758 [Toxocara canis]